MPLLEIESPVLNRKGEIVAKRHGIAEQLTEDLGRGIRLHMIRVPEGNFQMGSPRGHGNPDEYPRHFVTIKSFLISRFLITQEQWKAVMGTLPRRRFKGNHFPVERVSWEDAQPFCQRLSRKTGQTYALPSERQWEYACRAGNSTPFSFGETLTIDVANFNGEHIFAEEPRGSYLHSTSEGGRFPPNAFGLCDMHGNLWEWCADSWLDDYTSSPRDSGSYQNSGSRFRVVRGGSWHEPAALCRSASRLRVLQSDADEFMGFRVVCAVLETRSSAQ